MSVLSQRRRAIISSGGRAAIDSGKCGDNAYWKLYDDGTLEITGSGAIYNYSFGSAPWFEYTTLITFAKISNYITSIGNFAFYRCTSLAIASLPSGLTSIGTSAFEDCKNLALTELPSGVTSIGNYAFSNCTSLALSSLPSGLTSINQYAFYGCKSLALTELPSGLRTISPSVFEGCKSLALTELPSGVRTIGKSAFYGCKSLALTELPSGVTSIGNNAFQNCTAITNIAVPNGVTNTMAGVFIGVDGATVTYGTGVTKCTETPGANNQTVIFLGNVTDFGRKSMQYIYNATVEFRNNTVVPSITSFGDIYSGTKEIIVPDALYDEWIAAPVWSTHPEWIIKASEV